MYNLRNEYLKGHPMNLIAKLLMNSLYGKFGMIMETTKVEIIDNNKNKINKYLDKFNTSIEDIIYLENYTILIINTNEFKPGDIDNNEDLFHGQDVNISIASAITAYGRIRMSYFKNNPLFKLYYSDTDSAVVNKPLPDFMIGSELGKLKLEHTIDKAVFLAPKVYGLVTEDGTEIIKAKGLTKDSIKDIKVSDLELLLRKDSNKLFSQTKGFKDLFDASISVADIIYTLKATSNKRQLIYKNGIFDSTKPYNYDKIKSN